MEPWPFRIHSFRVFYEYKILEQLQFDTIEEFNEACETAKVEQAVFTIRK